MVRDGIEGDIPAVVAMSSEFWKFTAYDEEFDPIQGAHMAAACLSHGLLAILEVDGVIQGFTAALKAPLLGSGRTLMATEVAWWVNKEARNKQNGIALLKHMEGMAKAQGVKHWNMVVMESCQPEVAAAIYEANGYRKIETTYTRIL